VLDAGAKQLQTQLAQQPRLEASFSVVLGRIYAGLGEHERAIVLLQRALDLRQGDERDETSHADILALLARAQYEKGDYPAAARSSAAANSEHRAQGRAESAMIAQDLALQGETARRQGEFGKGELLLKQALAMSRSILHAPDAQIAEQLNQLAALYGDMGRNLGVFRMQTGNIAQALPAFDQAIDIYRRLLPNDHPLHALALANEARAFDRLKRYREADPLYRDALAIQRRVLGGQHPDLATTLNNLAVLRMHVDDFSGSADYSREAMAIWAAQGKPEHPFALISKAHLAVALRESGDLAQSERISREVLSARRRQLGENNRAVASSLDDLGIVLRISGHADQAVIQQRLAQEIRRGLSDVPASEGALARVQYALSESAAGDSQNARLEVDAGIAALTSMNAPDSDQLATAFIAKAHIELAQNDIAAACIQARQALSLRPPDDAATGWRHAEAQAVFGECLAESRQLGLARLQLQAALATLQRVRGADHWMTRNVRARLSHYSNSGDIG
jgi:tetratricopeptide (TPR) repeat protein